jgi:hypothetical protein
MQEKMKKVRKTYLSHANKNCFPINNNPKLKKSIQNSKRSIKTYLASTQGQSLEIIPLQ